MGGCKDFSVDANVSIVEVDFTLGGSFCTPPPPSGPCWLTGGGTIGKTKGVPDYNFGGVVNPGCSPTAAGGGNWNVVDHLHNLHFKGLEISVIACSGGPDKAPAVNVNTIDFQGTGTLKGIAGNSMPETPVCFLGHAEDHGEPGGVEDRLYLNVYDCACLCLSRRDPMSGLAVPSTVRGPLVLLRNNIGKRLRFNDLTAKGFSHFFQTVQL